VILSEPLAGQRARAGARAAAAQARVRAWVDGKGGGRMKDLIRMDNFHFLGCNEHPVSFLNGKVTIYPKHFWPDLSICSKRLLS